MDNEMETELPNTHLLLWVSGRSRKGLERGSGNERV